PQFGQDGHAVPRGFSQEANEAMEPGGTLQRDLDRGTPPARGTTHDRTILTDTGTPTRHSTRRQLRGYLQTTSIDDEERSYAVGTLGKIALTKSLFFLTQTRPRIIQETDCVNAIEVDAHPQSAI